ncbi:MAG: alpha/beta hydrolase [Stagnimonas sp.]|nr:alpha/beta hydrolase [Stagnimonas sp.]
MNALQRLAVSLEMPGGPRVARRQREGWPASTREDVGFYQGARAQIRYRERGQGRPIVFVADPPVTLELYDELLELYAGHFRVVVFELPGMGFSTPGAGYDLRFQPANDGVAEFLQAVVGEPAVLAFSCVAGFIAVDLANRYPQLVSHLVLIQTPSWSEAVRWKHSRDPKGVLGRPFIGQLVMNRMKRSRAPLWFQLALGGRGGHYEPFCDCAQDSIRRGAGWALASAFQHYLTDQSPPLPLVRQPLLALWGLRDQSHAPTDKSSTERLAQRAESEHYPDLGHFPELEDPPRVLARIRRFLGDDAGP